VNISDVEKLVRASQLGNRGAFDELVRLYQWRAMEVAVRILGDVEAGSEVVQQGFVTAYLKIKKLREAKRFKVWLLRIVTNTAFSQLRAAKRRKEKIRVAYCYAPKAASPVEKGIAEELEEAIKRAMLKLSRKEAKAISLFGLEDLSQREVAQIMGCSLEAVRWYVFRARQKLKVLLKEYL
jgi:RNA polymerase sigma-70 factor (ECF subfamily)